MQSPPRPVLTTRGLRGDCEEVSATFPGRFPPDSGGFQQRWMFHGDATWPQRVPVGSAAVRHTMYCLAWIRSLFPSATAITPVRPLIVCSAAEDTHNGKQSSRCTVMRRERPRVRRTRRGCYSAGACASVRACVPRRMGSGIGPAHAPAEGKMRRRAKKTI